MPVVAVIFFGSPTVSSGSSTAYLGRIEGSLIEALWCVAASVITAASGLEVDLNADTRHLFAYVPQGNTILSGTLAENMRMAKADATDEEIVEALKTATMPPTRKSWRP